MMIVAFFLGFVASAGVFAGVTYYTLNSVTINKLEAKAKINLETDKFIGENPEVDLRDTSLIPTTVLRYWSWPRCGAFPPCW